VVFTYPQVFFGHNIAIRDFKIVEKQQMDIAFTMSCAKMIHGGIFLHIFVFAGEGGFVILTVDVKQKLDFL